MKVLIHKYNKELPFDLIGKIVEIDEDLNVVDSEFKIKLKPTDFKKVYKTEDDDLILKLLKGEKLEERELEDLFFEYDDLVLESGSNHPGRWSQVKWNKINAFGRYFLVQGNIGLTEFQENMFYEQPEELSFNPEVRTIQMFNFNLGRLVK